MVRCQAIGDLGSMLLPYIAWECLKMERVMGIEPTLAAWEAAVLPLNYTRGSANPILAGGLWASEVIFDEGSASRSCTLTGSWASSAL